MSFKNDLFPTFTFTSWNILKGAHKRKSLVQRNTRDFLANLQKVINNILPRQDIYYIIHIHNERIINYEGQ